MTCTTIGGPNGISITMCLRSKRTPRCHRCGRPSTKQCDYPLAGRRKGKTCDRHLCDACAVSMGNVERARDGVTVTDTLDYCLAHAELAKGGAPCP